MVVQRKIPPTMRVLAIDKFTGEQHRVPQKEGMTVSEALEVASKLYPTEDFRYLLAYIPMEGDE